MVNTEGNVLTQVFQNEKIVLSSTYSAMNKTSNKFLSKEEVFATKSQL